MSLSEKINESNFEFYLTAFSFPCKSTTSSSYQKRCLYSRGSAVSLCNTETSPKKIMLCSRWDKNYNSSCIHKNVTYRFLRKPGWGFCSNEPWYLFQYLKSVTEVLCSYDIGCFNPNTVKHKFYYVHTLNNTYILYFASSWFSFLFQNYEFFCFNHYWIW